METRRRLVLKKLNKKRKKNMARFDRCAICDYTEATGSAILGISPGKNGKVRLARERGDMRCEACQSEIKKAAIDLRPPAEVDEDLVLLEE